MRKLFKVSVSLIVMALGIFCLVILPKLSLFKPHSANVAGRLQSPKATSNHVSLLSNDSHSRNVASIVYLTSTGLPTGTLAALQQMHVKTVYLYVAYHSDAYFSIPQNSFGIASPADTLQSAINTLHMANMSVVAVISSALLDVKQATPAGLDLLQYHSDIFDPLTAKPFLMSMVESLVKYPVDGIYVGEPYFTVPEQGLGLSQAQKDQWVQLYNGLLTVTNKAKIPFTMVLPDNYTYGVEAINRSGLPATFPNIPFAQIGIDLEDAYSGHESDDLQRFTMALRKMKSFAQHRPLIVEISLRQGDLKTPIPPEFFAKEVQIARDEGAQTILVFANEFWATSPYTNDYAKALQSFQVQ